MAYFDSSKNRAMWEIELAALRKEKAARKAGIIREVTPEQQVEKENTRVRMTYQELLKEEAEAARKQPLRQRREPAMERGPKEKEVMAYGKR